MYTLNWFKEKIFIFSRLELEKKKKKYFGRVCLLTIFDLNGMISSSHDVEK